MLQLSNPSQLCPISSGCHAPGGIAFATLNRPLMVVDHVGCRDWDNCSTYPQSLGDDGKANAVAAEGILFELLASIKNYLKHQSGYESYAEFVLTKRGDSVLNAFFGSADITKKVRTGRGGRGWQMQLLFAELALHSKKRHSRPGGRLFNCTCTGSDFQRNPVPLLCVTSSALVLSAAMTREEVWLAAVVVGCSHLLASACLTLCPAARHGCRRATPSSVSRPCTRAARPTCASIGCTRPTSGWGR